MANMITGNWDLLKEKLELKIKEIFKDKDISKLSKYEVRRTIYDYFCDNLKYDYELLKNMKDPDFYRDGGKREPYLEIESVLNDNIGICNSISQVYIMLLEQVGIDSKFIVCDDGIIGTHALTLVYDEEHNIYSLDDITSVIVGRGDKDRFFDYSLTMAGIYGQGNKPIDKDKRWEIVGNGYIDFLVGRTPGRTFLFEEIPSNISSVKIMNKDYYSLNSPAELMEYMDLNIQYGWIDKNGGRHENDLTGLRENYRVSSLEETLNSHLGTCIEQANVIKTFFDRIGRETKVFCHRSYETEDNFDKEVRMHCFVLFKGKEKWYHFEHSNQGRKGIHPYNSVEEAIQDITSGYKEKGDIRKITEIPELPAGLSFKEFNEYVNSFDNDTKKFQ